MPSVHAPIPPTALHGTVLRIGPWRIDTATRTAIDGQRERSLSPRAIKLIEVLAAADGAVLSRDRLLTQVWPDVYVSDESLTQAVSEIRRSLGDKSVIQTIPRAGYRLSVPVGRDEADTGPLPDAPDGAFDFEAYTLCLEARAVQTRCGPGALERAQALTEEAVDRAPGYAMARADHAIALVRRHLYWAGGVNWLPAALAEAEAALSLDPNLAFSQGAMAYVLSAIGRHDQADRYWGQALALDPYNADLHVVAGRDRFARRDFRGAAALGERAAAIAPDDIQGLFNAARCSPAIGPERQLRNARAAVQRIQMRLTADPDEVRSLYAFAVLMALLGEKQSAAHAIESIRIEDSAQGFYGVLGHAMLGHYDLAVEALEALFDNGWQDVAWLDAEPALAPLLQERRYRRMRDSFRAA